MQLTWSILAENPIETALSLLIKNDDYFNNKVEVFSTATNALRFLHVSLSEEELFDDNFLKIL